jgi:alpha-D-xyloside xylohydrolase
VEVCLYQAKLGATTTLINSDGEEIGTLRVGDDGHLLDQKFLDGAWHVSKNGRSGVKTQGTSD